MTIYQRNFALGSLSDGGYDFLELPALATPAVTAPSALPELPTWIWLLGGLTALYLLVDRNYWKWDVREERRRSAARIDRIKQTRGLAGRMHSYAARTRHKRPKWAR